MNISRAFYAWCIWCPACKYERTIVDDISGDNEEPKYCPQCGGEL